MALIAMAVHDTEENNRHRLTSRTLVSLHENDNLKSDNYFFIVSNGYYEPSSEMITWFCEKNEMRRFHIQLDTNIGTAQAINLAWRHRRPGHMLVKMDNDVIIHAKNDEWIGLLTDAIERTARSARPIGIAALKRRDLAEHPDRTDWAKSELVFAPKSAAGTWLPIEYVDHCMGTVQMYSPALIDKIGGLRQFGLYGFDDSLAAVRAKVAGYYSAFVPHVVIDHIDHGGDDYTKWKQEYAGQRMNEFLDLRYKIEQGIEPYNYPL